LITPSSPPSSERFWRFTIFALLGIPLTLFCLIQLIQGYTSLPVILVPLSAAASPFNAWITYLQIKAPQQPLDDVSRSNMPTLTRCAEAREQRWLRQWRLATTGKLLARVVIVLFIAAVLAGRAVH
jgi:hypothetical protein